jgi:hypothetical protein
MAHKLSEILLGISISQENGSEFKSDKLEMAKFFLENKKNYGILKNLRFDGSSLAPYCHELEEATFILNYSNLICFGPELRSYRTVLHNAKPYFERNIKPNLSKKEIEEIEKLGKLFWEEFGV